VKIDDTFDRILEPARHRPAIQGFFSLLSRAGEFSLVWHSIIWLRAIGSTDRAKEAVAFSLMLGIESLIVNQGLKRIFRRQRPTTGGDDRFNVRTPVTSSFPSGHASSAFFAATLLSLILADTGSTWLPWSIALYVLAVLVALSRVMVRLHHLSDIVGGAVVGVVLGVLAGPLVV
jgi:membrane-associated phospholipid phosphatase